MKIRKTRIIALALAMLMALTLAACGGNTTPPANNTPSPTQNETPTPPPPSDNGGDPGTTTDGNGNGDADSGSGIPDNGTPPDLPPQFQSHPGDKGYFYVTTDDYAFWKTVHGDVEIYCLISFEADGTAVNYQWKYVYSSIEKADNRAWKFGDFIQTDNAVYRNPDCDDFGPEIDMHYMYPPGNTKESVLDSLRDPERMVLEQYISKP